MNRFHTGKQHAMKNLLLSLLILGALTTRAQKAEVRPTNEFVVTGLVKHEVTITLEDIGKLAAKDIPDLAVTSHQGEPRGNLKQVKGVLLKDLLQNIALKEDNPKLFSEFYFTFTASDNYKVVYSWNELFNSPTGNNIFIVTAIDGEPLQQMRNRILVITTTDFKTGRRHIKGLDKIVVGRTA